MPPSVRRRAAARSGADRQRLPAQRPAPAEEPDQDRVAVAVEAALRPVERAGRTAPGWCRRETTRGSGRSPTHAQDRRGPGGSGPSRPGGWSGRPARSGPPGSAARGRRGGAQDGDARSDVGDHRDGEQRREPARSSAKRRRGTAANRVRSRPVAAHRVATLRGDAATSTRKASRSDRESGAQETDRTPRSVRARTRRDVPGGRRRRGRSAACRPTPGAAKVRPSGDQAISGQSAHGSRRVAPVARVGDQDAARQNGDLRRRPGTRSARSRRPSGGRVDAGGCSQGLVAGPNRTPLACRRLPACSWAWVGPGTGRGRSTGARVAVRTAATATTSRGERARSSPAGAACGCVGRRPACRERAGRRPRGRAAPRPPATALVEAHRSSSCSIPSCAARVWRPAVEVHLGGSVADAEGVGDVGDVEAVDVAQGDALRLAPRQRGDPGPELVVDPRRSGDVRTPVRPGAVGQPDQGPDLDHPAAERRHRQVRAHAAGEGRGVVAAADVTPASVRREHRLLRDVLRLRATAEAGRQA